MATPSGTPTKINYSKMDEETIRSLTRENEAAETLAKRGYDIEQNPKVDGNKNPDYLIEGKIFDCYSPKADTPVDNIYRNIKAKIDAGQTNRIVLNLDDWNGGGGDIQDIIRLLNNNPIPGLEEVIGIDQYHQIIGIY